MEKDKMYPLKTRLSEIHYGGSTYSSQYKDAAGRVLKIFPARYLKKDCGEPKTIYRSYGYLAFELYDDTFVFLGHNGFWAVGNNKTRMPLL